jgi:putative SOS response-associated peptidase YedK
MCGRYVLAEDQNNLLEHFGANLDPDLVGREFRSNYNIAPSVKVPIVTSQSGERLLTQVRWGIIRILIPASGYFEWKRPAKDPFYISTPVGDPGPLAMAGLVAKSVIEGVVVPTCAIITLPAQPNLEAIHDRMPACIDTPHWNAWLDPGVDSETALGFLVARSNLQATAVGRAVNSVRNNSPALIQWSTEAD